MLQKIESMPSKMKVLGHLGAILWLRQKFKPEEQIWNIIIIQALRIHGSWKYRGVMECKFCEMWAPQNHMI